MDVSEKTAADILSILSLPNIVRITSIVGIVTTLLTLVLIGYYLFYINDRCFARENISPENDIKAIFKTIAVPSGVDKEKKQIMDFSSQTKKMESVR